jgi:hypothetical protein
MEEEKYIKGFNQGYALSQHDAELAASIAESVKDKDNPIWQGFIAGGNEFLKENKEKDRFMNMHQNYKVSDKGSNQDKEPQKENPRDKGNFERD